MEPRVIKARNSGPFTLDGTRTYLIGGDQAAVIDPGPDEEDHIRALSAALEPARDVKILLTHHHRDHAGAAVRLGRETGGRIFGPPSCAPGAAAAGITGRRSVGSPDILFQELSEGDEVPTSLGEIVAVRIPGHTKDHLGFLWRGAGALFVGDLLLGRGDTTWIGEYPGCVRDYLSSLDRVEALDPAVIYPGHGPPITTPGLALERYRRHRQQRLEQVSAARRANPSAGAEEIAAAIYGGQLPEKLLKAARASVEAALFHLDQEGGWA